MRIFARQSFQGFVKGEDLFGGVDLGARVQTPTRLAPFVGVGTFLGYSEHEVCGEHDWIDNDDDGWTDEWGEKDTETGFLAAVYPELGAHFWLNGRARLTVSGAYLVTTEGRNSDFWFFGVGFGWLVGP